MEVNFEWKLPCDVGEGTYCISRPCECRPVFWISECPAAVTHCLLDGSEVAREEIYYAVWGNDDALPSETRLDFVSRKDGPRGRFRVRRAFVVFD